MLGTGVSALWPGSGRVSAIHRGGWSGETLMAEHRFSPWRTIGGVEAWKTDSLLQGMSVLARVTSIQNALELAKGLIGARGRGHTEASPRPPLTGQGDVSRLVPRVVVP